MSESPYEHFLFLRNPEELPAWGGLEKLLLEWLERIDYTRCRVTLAVPKYWIAIFQKKSQEKGIPINIIELPFESKKPLSLRRLFKIYRFIKLLKPDAVIFMQGWFYSFDIVYVFAAWLHTRKVFMHENLGSIELPKYDTPYPGGIPRLGLWRHASIWAVKLRALFSRKILVVSREIKEQLVSWWQYPPQKVVLQYHGIDLNVFCPSQEHRYPLRQSLGIPLQDTVIITTARLSRVKRIDRAIEAFGVLYGVSPDISLLIVGDGIMEDDLKKMAASLPCSHKIKFAGHVDHVADYLNMSDIYLLSSDNEGFGLSMIEAMATGLICVATKCPGPNEIIQDGLNGFLADKNTNGVSTGLRKALRLDEDQRKKMRQTAMAFTAQNFEIGEKVRSAFGILGVPVLRKP